MSEAFFSLGLVVGLLGSAHCAGMCGGLMAAFCLGGPVRRGWLFLLSYQAGRIATYAGLGWAGATLGGLLFASPWFATGAKGVLILSDLMVIFLGLAGLGLFSRLPAALGSPGWLGKPMGALVSGAGRYPALPAGFLLGLAFGFIPCGLLYPVLLGAAQTGDPLRGAATMLGFGLGTAPALLATGAGAGKLFALSGRFQKVAWTVVLLMGSCNFYRHLMAWTVKASCCGG